MKVHTHGGGGSIGSDY
jgi:hypothetical protein